MADAQLGRGMGWRCNAQYGSGEQVSVHGCSPWLWTDIIARPMISGICVTTAFPILCLLQ
jgi:hypothetical protein